MAKYSPFFYAYLVAAVGFVENLDGSVLNTALPSIARDFAIPAAALSVAVSSYLIAVMLGTPLAGWISKRVGAKKVLLSALGLFVGASLGCAFSPSLAVFITMRIIQGIAGAMMAPVGRMMVLQNSSSEQRIRLMATLTWPGLLAPILGPVVGGVICTYWHWSWIFLLNVPIGAVLFGCIWLTFEELPSSSSNFDYLGFSLITLGLTPFMVVIELANELSVGMSLLILAISAVVMAGAIYHLLHSSQPLFHLHAFRHRSFRVSNRGGMLFRLVISCVPFVLPLMMQLAMGYSAAASGAMLLWLFVGNLLTKSRTTWLITTFGFRRVLKINGLCVALSLVLCAQISLHQPDWILAILFFFCGVVRSLQFTTLSTLSVIDLPKNEIFDGSTINSIIRTMSRALGIACCGLLLRILPQTQWVADNSTGLFSLVFYILAAMALVAWFDVLRLPKSVSMQSNQ